MEKRIYPLPDPIDQQTGRSLEGGTSVLYATLDGNRFPLLIPIDLMSWWSQEFLAVSAAARPSTCYFDWTRFTLLLDAEPGSWQDALTGPIPRAGSLLVTDSLDIEESRVKEAVKAFSEAFGLESTTKELVDGERAVEEYHVLRTRRLDGTDQPLDLHGTWGAIRDSHRPSDPEHFRAEVLTNPSDGVRSAVWEFYIASMMELTRSHPTRAEISRDEFNSLVDSDSAAVLVGFEFDEPTSMAILGPDLDEFQFISPEWVRRTCAGWIETNVLICPAIATRSDGRRQGSMVKLLNLVRELVSTSGSAICIIFPCDNMSRNYSPHIVQLVLSEASEELGGFIECADTVEFMGHELAESASA